MTATRSHFMFVWGMPILLGILSTFGLLAALLGTGIWHWASWLSLAWLLVVIARYWLRPVRRERG
ncbi:membrane protein [Bordetella ansorpii]|uniref:Membrane protein n=1 Tax=Bordetella ansorpii TaxID=288768 RepID=A0A157SVQ8_9BORD|nr:hypothetical protein [Bordetella ansorpii]SAI74548.1 membrane protein [Bordetella ansorpii]